MWTCNKVVKKLMRYALRYEITDLNKLKFTFYVLYIYVNLKKTEHLFTSIKLLEKKETCLCSCDGRLYDFSFLRHYPITNVPITLS